MSTLRQPRQRPPLFRLNPQHDLAQGLVFANFGAFTGSDLYYDSSLYQRNGTLSGYTADGDLPAQMWTYDNSIGRLLLSASAASSNKVSFANPLYGLQAWSLSAWFKSTAGGNILDTRTADGQSGWLVYANGSLYFQIRRSGASTSCHGTATIGDTTAHHVTVVYNSAVSVVPAFYVDGVLDTIAANTITAAITGGNTTAAMFYSAPYGSYTSNTLGDLCGYNYPLPAGLIQQLANPANVMLSGLLEPVGTPQRKRRAFGSSPTGPTNYAAVLHHHLSLLHAR